MSQPLLRLWQLLLLVHPVLVRSSGLVVTTDIFFEAEGFCCQQTLGIRDRLEMWVGVEEFAVVVVDYGFVGLTDDDLNSNMNDYCCGLHW